MMIIMALNPGKVTFSLDLLKHVTHYDRVAGYLAYLLINLRIHKSLAKLLPAVSQMRMIKAKPQTSKSLNWVLSKQILLSV